MTNPSKSKGTWAESAFVKHVHLNGFPGAERIALNGNKDKGDVGLCPGIVVEVKNVKLGAGGLPTDGQLGEWLRQSEAERQNAGAAFCPLVVKRPGTQDVGRWLVYMAATDFLDLTALEVRGVGTVDHQPVMVSVATLLFILRSAGYGEPISQ